MCGTVERAGVTAGGYDKDVLRLVLQHEAGMTFG